MNPGFTPTAEDRRHLALIGWLAREAPFPFWLSGGWGLDARIGRVTRSHDDIDIAFPSERLDAFVGMLRSAGCDDLEWNDYGFLTRLSGILLDCEPCELRAEGYELDGVPEGSCPPGFEGVLEEIPVRCTSLRAMAWDYFHYQLEVPLADWPAKSLEGLEVLRGVTGPALMDEWHAGFKAAMDLAEREPGNLPLD